MKDYEFLGVINGIYNFPADADFNIWTTLLVYIDTDRETLIIKEHSLYLEDGQENVRDYEEVLNIGSLQLEVIYSNFSEPILKELIFNMYLDYQGIPKHYDKIF